MVASENYFQRMVEAKINQKPRDVKSRGFDLEGNDTTNRLTISLTVVVVVHIAVGRSDEPSFAVAVLG